MSFLQTMERQNGNFNIGYIKIPFEIRQDSDNSFYMTIGFEGGNYFAKIEVILDDDGNIVVRGFKRGSGIVEQFNLPSPIHDRENLPDEDENDK